jgi:hypothetical protein
VAAGREPIDAVIGHLGARDESGIEKCLAVEVENGFIFFFKMQKCFG